MKQFFISFKILFLFFFTISYQIMGNESEPICKAIPSSDHLTIKQDNSPEILKQTGNVFMNIINLSQNPENSECVIPALANIFHGMLNIALLASRRSLSFNEFIKHVNEYIQTEEGQTMLKNWRAMTIEQAS